MALLILLLAANTAFAGDLLIPASSGDVRNAAAASANPELIKRSRLVRIDQRELAAQVFPLGIDHAPDRTERASKLGGIVRLRLFPDAVVTLHRTDVESIERGGIGWAGVADEHPHSDALFVIRGGQIYGHVRAGRKTYRIAPMGGGLHRVVEVETSKLPHRDDAIRIPARGQRGQMMGPAKSAAATTTVDVLVVYTQRAARGIEGEIDYQFLHANRAFKRSNVPIVLRPAGSGLAEDLDERCCTLKDLLFKFHDEPNLAKRARDLTGADLVSLWVDKRGKAEACGWAYTPDVPDPAVTDIDGYSVIDLGCLDPGLFAHEIAHNFGADHDRYAIKKWDSKTYPKSEYKFGYVNVKRELRDIMSYPDKCTDILGHDCVELGVFSSSTPCTKSMDPHCDPNAVIGVAQGKPEAADASRTLRQNRFAVAQYRTKWMITPEAVTLLENSGRAKFTLTRRDPTGAKTVYITTLAGEGAGGDTVVQMQNKKPLTFADGQKSKSLTVKLADNCQADQPKNFSIIAQLHESDPHEFFAAKAQFTVIDDDGTWTLSPPGGILEEHAGPAIFELARTDSSRSEQVFVSTKEDKGWSNDNDYIALDNVGIVFGVGEKTKQIKVEIVNDLVQDAPVAGILKTFGLSVTRNKKCTLESSFTIDDDDVWAFDPAQIFEPLPHGDGSSQIGLVRAGSDPTVAKVYVTTTTDKGFTNNNNFIPLTDYPVTFAAGEILKQVPLQVLYNAQADGSREFGVVAKDESGRILAKGSFTIVDNGSTD